MCRPDRKRTSPTTVVVSFAPNHVILEHAPVRYPTHHHRHQLPPQQDRTALMSPTSPFPVVGEGRRNQFHHRPNTPTLRDARLQDLTDHQRLFIFIKIMIKIMQQHNENEAVRVAKSTIGACLRLHKTGDPNYVFFQDAVIVRLRAIIPELYWNLTREYLGYGCD